MTGVTELDRDLVDVPGAPAIPGLRFRRLRGREDHAGMIEAITAIHAAYSIEDTVNPEGFAAHYDHLTNSDLGRDLVLVELDGRVRGYYRVEWGDRIDGTRGYTSVAMLHPELQGRGIGSAMLAWVERRQREIAAGQADDGRPRLYEASSWDRNEAAGRLLREHGYVEARRGYEMVRDTLHAIPEAPMPDGLEVRPVTSADLRRVWEAMSETFRDTWGEEDDSEEAWLRFAENPQLDPDLFVVGFDGDEIAGLVLPIMDDADAADGARPEGVLGLLASVAVRRPWRRRGLARALLVRSLQRLRDRGATRAYLGVDGENPNRAMTLYESCGFRIASSSTTWLKPLETGGAPR